MRCEPHLLTDSGSFPFSDEKNNPPQEGTHVTKISFINALQGQSIDQGLMVGLQPGKKERDSHFRMSARALCW